MIIESIIGLVVVSVVVYVLWKSIADDTSVADVNQDGKTDIKDAVAVAEKAVDAVEDVVEKAIEKVVDVIDVNDDGKVNVKDAEAVVEKVKKNVRGKVDKSEPAAKPKRARNKGKFVADNKSTPDVNEAWEGGKAPASKPRKPKKPKMTVVKK